MPAHQRANNFGESSFDSRMQPQPSGNHSNVQIICRINAPSKQSSTFSVKAGVKRPNSATRIHFASNLTSSQGPSFKGKEQPTRNVLKLVNPSRSFVSV